MGTEIIPLFVPIVLIHLVWVVHRSTAPGRRLRAQVLLAIGLAAIFAILKAADGSLELFLTFGTLLYLAIVVPATFISSLVKRARKSLSRGQEAKRP